ncbi:MAG TPA: nucleotide exchange factor GrpE [Candidatus Acidoferrales bacterium]|nr:nucleotide exchange factor GrpE [Candidatus Acidoferrales bacterium]
MIEDDAASSPNGPSLQERLAAANAKAEDNYNKFLLAMADFENYKKRMSRDIESIVTSHRRSLLERFLPVIDNLERALQYDAGGEKLRGGIEQTLKGFEAVLASEGVKPIDVKGKPFDPRVAEAIGTAPPIDGGAEDTVVDVAQKGYNIGEELLRPAKVIVAKNSG